MLKFKDHELAYLTLHTASLFKETFNKDTFVVVNDLEKIIESQENLESAVELLYTLINAKNIELKYDVFRAEVDAIPLGQLVGPLQEALGKALQIKTTVESKKK